MRNYLNKLYDARYFWMHLARIELKNKFRRSKLGILWIFVSPLCLTAIMSVVFATAFHVDIASYAPYILSGILCWEVFSGGFIGGSYGFISNDAYIRQFNHPVTIYTLKSAIVITISFLISLIALAVWILFLSPFHLLLAVFTLPTTLILQTLWYVSPVFFQKEMFDNSEILSAWFHLNPITHVLQLIRAPFLEGRLPGIFDYLMSFALVGIIALFAVYMNRKSARDIIFYI